MRPPVDDPDDDDDGEDQAGAEQDLLVVFRLSNRQMGTNQERQELEALGEQLEAAIEAAGVGEYDGDELGGGECTLFFCGPDIDALLTVVRHHLKRSPWSRGAQIVRMVAGADGKLAPQRQPL